MKCILEIQPNQKLGEKQACSHGRGANGFRRRFVAGNRQRWAGRPSRRHRRRMMKSNQTEFADLSQPSTDSAVLSASPAITAALRFGAQIAAVGNCPNNANAPFAESAYRGVRAPVALPDDFLPLGIIDPDRFASDSPNKRCSSLAISLFESIDQMRKRFSSVEKTSRNFKKKLVGMHCARLQLTSKDGRRTHAQSNGHFSFYQFETFDGVAAVVEVVQL
jgi:hypothetical protein